MLKLRQLAWFCEIAKRESITKASETSFISQQALARSLHQLEDELGCDLFDRVGHRLKLNEKGKVTLIYSNQIFNLVESLYGAMREETDA